MTGTNTTKSGPVPGGLGLKLLQEFVRKNNGSIIIASGQGYWELRQNRKTLRHLELPFPGTVVNIELNTADTSAYYLTSEIKSEKIF